jgi:hypothetical protein
MYKEKCAQLSENLNAATSSAYRCQNCAPIEVLLIIYLLYTMKFLHLKAEYEYVGQYCLSTRFIM